MGRRAEEIALEKRPCAMCGIWHWCPVERWRQAMALDLCFACWRHRNG